MTFNSSALVLDGRSHTSLAIIRNLGRHGISVRTVDTSPSDYGISRYTNDAVLLEKESDEALLESLIAISREGEPPVLFPASPAYAAFVARHFSLLKNYFRFPAESPEGIFWRGSTDMFDDLMPATVDLDGETLQATELKIATTIGFPCLIRRRVKDVRDLSVPAEFISSPGALSRVLEKIFDPGNYFAERFIPGEASDNSSAVLYYGAGGELAGFVTAEVLRQWPENVGEATYMKQKWIPELIGLVHPRLKEAGFRGLIRVRFKRDEFSRKVYITGADTAFPPETELYSHLGFELPYLYYLDATGEELPHIFFQSDTNCHFKDGFNDLRAISNYLKTGHMGLMKIISDYKFRKVPATWAWDDMGPGLNKLGAESLSKAKGMRDNMPLKK
ncbi:MAG: hypothetical protein ACLVLI_04920 [Aedoeadaptatus pacaensis]